MEDVFESGYHESPLGYDNVDWFLNEFTKKETKSAFYFKNFEKINMTEEHEEGFKNNDVYQFCEIEFISDKVGNHCHLTGKYRSPAHNTCNINVTQNQNSFYTICISQLK